MESTCSELPDPNGKLLASVKDTNEAVKTYNHSDIWMNNNGNMKMSSPWLVSFIEHYHGILYSFLCNVFPHHGYKHECIIYYDTY